MTRNRLWKKDRHLQTMRPVLGDGLLSSEGDFWRRQRRLAQPAFHRDRIASYGEIMVTHATRLAEKWRDGEVRDVHKDMMTLTLEIVAETLFGANVGDQAEEVAVALEAVISVVSDPLELFFPVLARLPTPQPPALRSRREEARFDHLRPHRQASQERGGGDQRPSLDAAPRAGRRRHAHVRQAAARRVHDALPRRSRDDGAQPLLDVAAPLAASRDSREARARARRGARRSPGDVRRSSEAPVHRARHRGVAAPVSAGVVDGTRGARGRRDRRLSRAPRRSGLVLSLGHPA